MVNTYVTVFDISRTRFDWTYTIGTGMFMLMIAMLSLRRSRRGMVAKVLLLQITTVVVFLSSYIPYYRLKAQYTRGNFTVVEGPVTDFRPLPRGIKGQERFRVRDKEFRYSGYSVMPGFHASLSHSGPMRAGLMVRVSYVGNDIAKLEIATAPNE